MTILQTLLANIQPIAVTAGVAFIAYNNYRSNKTSKAGEVIQNYATLEKQLKEQKADLEKKLADQASSHATQMNELHRRLGEKDATITSQNATIEEYKTILANRGHDVEDALRQIRDFMATIHGILVENRTISAANADELHEQTAILKDSAVKKVVLVGEIAAHDADVPLPPHQP